MTFKLNDRVSLPDGTLATFVRLDVSGLAIIRVGMDTRLANPVTLRKAVKQ